MCIKVVFGLTFFFYKLQVWEKSLVTNYCGPGPTTWVHLSDGDHLFTKQLHLSDGDRLFTKQLHLSDGDHLFTKQLHLSDGDHLFT